MCKKLKLETLQDRQNEIKLILFIIADYIDLEGKRLKQLSESDSYAYIEKKELNYFICWAEYNKSINDYDVFIKMLSEVDISEAFDLCMIVFNSISEDIEVNYDDKKQFLVNIMSTHKILLPMLL